MSYGETKHLSWREQFVIKVLLLVAQLVTEDSKAKEEIKTLLTHVSVWS